MVTYYKGQYYKGSFDDARAQAILDLLTMDKVPDLVHCIYNLDKADIKLLKESAENYEKENGSLRGYEPPKITKKIGKLADYQTVGVAFMYLSQRCLIGDETGMGKTVQIAGLVNFLRKQYEKMGKEFRYCFLGEKAGVEQLANKLMQFTGEYVGTIECSEQKYVKQYLEANKEKRYYSIVGGHALLTNSEFMLYCSRKPFDLMIFDESAKLKNRNSQMYKAASGLFPKQTYLVELNATPLEMNIWDFYNQLSLLDKDYLPNITQFQKYFCVRDYSKGMMCNDIKEYKHEEEFKKAIKLRYIARTRVETGAKYENNNVKVYYIEPSEEQKQLHKKTTLHQLVDDYPPDVNRNVPFTLTTTPKAAALVWLLRQIDIKKEKALIYCRFKNCQNTLKEVLEREGYSVEILNGETRKKERSRIITAFNGVDIDVLITNVQKCLDLNSCSHGIFYTIDSNPQNMVQFEGRLTREFDIIGNNTYLLVMMGREKKFVDEVLRTRAQASKSFAKTGESQVLGALQNEGIGEIFKLEWLPELEDKEQK